MQDLISEIESWKPRTCNLSKNVEGGPIVHRPLDASLPASAIPALSLQDVISPSSTQVMALLSPQTAISTRVHNADNCSLMKPVCYTTDDIMLGSCSIHQRNTNFFDTAVNAATICDHSGVSDSDRAKELSLNSAKERELPLTLHNVSESHRRHSLSD